MKGKSGERERERENNEMKRSTKGQNSPKNESGYRLNKVKIFKCLQKGLNIKLSMLKEIGQKTIRYRPEQSEK